MKKAKDKQWPVGTETMGTTVPARCQRAPWKNKYQYKFQPVDWRQDLSWFNFKKGLGFMSDIQDQLFQTTLVIVIHNRALYTRLMVGYCQSLFRSSQTRDSE